MGGSVSEQRVTSETGAAKGDKLARFDLIPTYALTLLAETYGRGLAKYPTEPGQKDNWRRGYAWSLSYAALQRHLNAFWSGEDYDPETGNHHLISAVFHAFSLVEWGRHPELVELYDDRQDSDPEPESFIDWSTVKPLPDGIYTMEFAAEGVSPEVLRLFYGDVTPNDDDGPDMERYWGEFEQTDLQPFMDQINTAVKGLQGSCSPSNPCRQCRNIFNIDNDKEVTE
jgi:hypothetical protein